MSRMDTGGPGGKPQVLVVPGPTLYRELFTPAADAALRDLADVTFNPRDVRWSPVELADALSGMDAVITGWGTPTFTEGVLRGADRLRLVAHSAGTVKSLLPPPVFARGIAVTSAASALAPAVAECALAMIFLGLRHLHRYDAALKSGAPWDGPQAYGTAHLIAGRRIGVIGASYVGRHFIALARALGAAVWVYDPYLPDDEAPALGATKVGLDELLSGCPIVTIHAPTTPETHHLIGARELALLPDDAFIVNTARSWILDMDALLRELESGRLRAAIDVFDEEPLALDSPFRHLENVILTPHIAGATVEVRYGQGDTVVGELRRYFAGEPLRFGITAERLAILA